MERAMTSDEKLKNIESQMKACEDGRTNVITCPYCGSQNVEPGPGDNPSLCCRLFAAAALAIIERQALEDSKRAVDRAIRN